MIAIPATEILRPGDTLLQPIRVKAKRATVSRFGPWWRLPSQFVSHLAWKTGHLLWHGGHLSWGCPSGTPCTPGGCCGCGGFLSMVTFSGVTYPGCAAELLNAGAGCAPTGNYGQVTSINSTYAFNTSSFVCLCATPQVGTVNFNQYSDAACTMPFPFGGGVAEATAFIGPITRNGIAGWRLVCAANSSGFGTNLFDGFLAGDGPWTLAGSPACRSGTRVFANANTAFELCINAQTQGIGGTISAGGACGSQPLHDAWGINGTATVTF